MLWLLHGNLGSPADWKPVSDRLHAAGISCRALNLWKYLECCPKSLEDMGKILCSEIAAQDKHPHLCGYSLGGRLAMHAVLAHAPLWRGAVFISSHPGMTDEREKEARRMTDAEWAVKCLSLPWEEFLQAWDAQTVFQGGSQDDDARDRSSLKPWRKSISRAFIDWSAGMQHDLLPSLNQSPVPLLWMAGERDAKFSALVRRAAGQNAVIVPGAGHRLPMEAPGETAEYIKQFMLNHP